MCKLSGVYLFRENISAICACGSAAIFFCIVFTDIAFAEKILIYDEEKGIVSVDKNAPAPVPGKSGAVAKTPQPINEKERIRIPSNGKSVDGIQRGRPKDPPEIYFESGLQYFKNGNFDDALKNFTYADSLDPQPKYLLWMGKSLRQVGKIGKLLFVMNRLITTYPESDVADDALFEIAFCYQANDDYNKAVKAYTKLAEQYPFGTSYSNGENFRNVAHEQIKIMRNEMIFSLRALGYVGDDIESILGSFQKDNGLSVNNSGDRSTVIAVKAAYEKLLEVKAAKELHRTRLKKYSKASLFICGLLFINFILLVVLNRKMAARKKNLAAINLMLSDLTMGVL
jgi:tetratricopeptide (TPR) repeat protein